MTLDRLEGLLEAYGGDLERWPDRHCDAARALIARSDAARKLHEEAIALDRVLMKCVGPDPARLSILTERIVAVSVRECRVSEDARGGVSGAGARIIPLPRAKPKVEPARAALVEATANSGASVTGRVNWRAIAALAASLAFGFAIGLTDTAPTTAAYTVASLVESRASDAEVALSAVQLDPLGALDEDQI